MCTEYRIRNTEYRRRMLEFKNRKAMYEKEVAPRRSQIVKSMSHTSEVPNRRHIAYDARMIQIFYIFSISKTL